MDGVIEPRLHGGWQGRLKDGVLTPPASSGAVLAFFPDLIEMLSSTPFDAIGSFWPDSDGRPALGPLIGGPSVKLDIGLNGPYTTFADFMNHRIAFQLKQLDIGRVHVTYHNPRLYYLALLELRDLINGDVEMNSPQPNYLFHADFWQFMFDAQRTRVVGIIDWE